MDRLTNKTQSVISAGGIVGRTAARDLMNSLIKALIKLGILTEDLDYHLAAYARGSGPPKCGVQNRNDRVKSSSF